MRHSEAKNLTLEYQKRYQATENSQTHLVASKTNVVKLYETTHCQKLCSNLQ